MRPGGFSLSSSLALASLAAVGSSATMTAKSSILTPERMLEAPRPNTGGVVIAPNEQRALIGASTHSFKDKKTQQTLYVVDLEGNKGKDAAAQKPLVHNTTSGLFLSDNEVAYLIKETLYVKKLDDGQNSADDAGKELFTFPAPVSNLRVVPAGEGKVTLLFSAVVYDVDGDLYKVKEHDESAEEKRWEDVKVYDDIRVREWDAWINPRKRSQLFTVELERPASADATWTYVKAAADAKPVFHNVVRSAGGPLSTVLETPIIPFGGANDFGATLDHGGWAAWVSKDPHLPNAWHTKSHVYVAPLAGKGEIRQLTTSEHGAVSGVVFSPDGTQLAWLQMARDGIESDRRQIVLAQHKESGKSVATAASADNVQQQFLVKDWDRSPTQLIFSRDGKTLYMLVEEEEHEKIFSLDVSDALAGKVSEPKVVSDAKGFSNVLPLSDGRLVVTASTQHSLPDLYLLSSGAKFSLTPLTTFNDALADIDFGPAPAQFSYPGAGGRDAYGWIHFPPGYDSKTKDKYALKVLIHGGPEGCWSDSWSTRWNPAVFAAAPGAKGSGDERGSIVILMDPAGSTSFGQAYQEEIIHSWGGKPYQDIIAGIHHILELYGDVIDKKRISASGASYGGYHVNWLQGHNQAGLFQCFVSHDGIYDLRAAWGETEELWFAEAEHGGTPWDSAELYEKWNPALHASNWNTPMLLIHGQKDYRLPDTQGLAAFNTLRRRGVDARFVHFANENHWVLDPDNSLLWHEEVLGWIAKYTGPKKAGKANGTSTKEEQESLVFQQ